MNRNKLAPNNNGESKMGVFGYVYLFFDCISSFTIAHPQMERAIIPSKIPIHPRSIVPIQLEYRGTVTRKQLSN
jgi:hypothetical protein